jgi:hypothetical protein
MRIKKIKRYQLANLRYSTYNKYIYYFINLIKLVDLSSRQLPFNTTRIVNKTLSHHDPKKFDLNNYTTLKDEFERLSQF